MHGVAQLNSEGQVLNLCGWSRMRRLRVQHDGPTYAHHLIHRCQLAVAHTQLPRCLTLFDLCTGQSDREASVWTGPVEHICLLEELGDRQWCRSGQTEPPVAIWPYLVVAVLGGGLEADGGAARADIGEKAGPEHSVAPLPNVCAAPHGLKRVVFRIETIRDQPEHTRSLVRKPNPWNQKCRGAGNEERQGNERVCALSEYRSMTALWR